MFNEKMPFEETNHEFARTKYNCPPNDRYYACVEGFRFGLKAFAEFILNNDLDTVIETCENIINNYEDD